MSTLTQAEQVLGTVAVVALGLVMLFVLVREFADPDGESDQASNDR